jgi:hypothetical protein
MAGSLRMVRIGPFEKLQRFIDLSRLECFECRKPQWRWPVYVCVAVPDLVGCSDGARKGKAAYVTDQKHRMEIDASLNMMSNTGVTAWQRC